MIARHARFLALWIVATLAGCGAAQTPTSSSPGGATTPPPRTTAAPNTSRIPATPEVAGLTARPLPQIQSGPIDPGTYLISKSSWTLVDWTVTIPEGWSIQYGETFNKGDHLGFYAVVVDRIYADACGGRGTPMRVEPGVDGLVVALLHQRGPKFSRPVDSTLGGRSAKRIDLTIPSDLDLDTCRLGAGGLQVWYSAPNDKYFVLPPDGSVSLYIIEAEHQPQVFLFGHLTTASAEEVAELQAIIESIHIAS